MKFLLTVILILSVSACSVHVDEMISESTPQKFDLIDSEGDGVINARDKCLESFAGAQVNNDGCGKEKTDNIRRKLEINFDINSYVVKPKFYNKIKELADFMDRYPTTNVTIEGHTSKRGSNQLNKALSENRAQAVKDLLITKFLIAKKRVTAVGYGSERLLVEGDDEYIHARNRRIMAEISSEIHIKDMKWNIYSVDERAE